MKYNMIGRMALLRESNGYMSFSYTAPGPDGDISLTHSVSPEPHSDIRLIVAEAEQELQKRYEKIRQAMDDLESLKVEA